jgi:phytoene desaturase
MRVVVVGAGLGGLSAACHLAGRGHDVTVVERDAGPGGRAGMVESDGFRLDTGPSVLTMPAILESTFAAAGADMADHVTLRPVDPLYRACFADGSELRVRRDPAEMAAEISTFAGARDAAGFERFVTWLRALYELEMPKFIDRNFDSALGLARDPRALLRLVRLGALRKLASTVASYFDDPRLQQVFSFQSMYAGLSPFEALAIYCVITYMDTVEGVFFPEGGIHTIACGLAAAAGRAGAQFVYGDPVERILCAPGGGIAGVRLESGARVDAAVVVSNADVVATYAELLERPAPRVARRGRYSPSCALWIAGTRGAPPVGSAHHNVHFGADWRGAFDALLRDGVCMPHPSILVSVPSVSDASLAPPGATSLYVLEPVPNLDGTVDWSKARDRHRAALVTRAAAFGYPVDDVVVEQWTDPEGWRAHGLERGTPFSLAHRFFQTGPFRPRNVDARVPGLVLAGMGTVPGVGVPMVLLSGRLAADRVDALATAAGRGSIRGSRP